MHLARSHTPLCQIPILLNLISSYRWRLLSILSFLFSLCSKFPLKFRPKKPNFKIQSQLSTEWLNIIWNSTVYRAYVLSTLCLVSYTYINKKKRNQSIGVFYLISKIVQPTASCAFPTLNCFKSVSTHTYHTHTSSTRIEKWTLIICKKKKKRKSIN